ncbi:hypothetical protein EON63_23690, partial [archaeon]
MHRNDYGMLPIHILASMCDDVYVCGMVFKVCMGCLYERDRQGRTPLHLAVLRVARRGEEVREE